jgi:endonuclease-3
MLTASQKKLLSLLEGLYPEIRSELNYSNEFELCVSVILSAQCTDKKVNEITPALFGKFPDFTSLNKASLAQIETIIRPINYYKSKSKNLKELARIVESNLAGVLPKTMEKLVELPGIGRKTASVVLGELGIIETLPVDTHVLRLSNRLGLSSGDNPKQVEEDLRKTFPAKTWRGLHHRLIFHGRRVCKARNPDCAACTLKKLCLFFKLSKELV